jgi:Uma2 family endonuclease
MTAAPGHRELMSLEQWRALGEDTSVRSELQEGVLIVSPSARPWHQEALLILGAQLLAQVPAGHRVVPEVDVLVDTMFPPTVRRPDLVVRRAGRVAEIPADMVLIAIEFLSPGTRRQDLVTKRSEYADALIPAYWIIDLDDGPSIEALTLVDGTYTGEVVTGVYETTVPFDLRIDLPA